MTNFLTNDIAWYVLRVKTNREHKVKNDLEAIVSSRSLTGEITDVCVPEKEEYVTKKGKTTLQKKVVYPGYVYVRMYMTDNNWYIVRNVSNVVGFLEAEKGQPVPLGNEEAAKIEAFMEKPERVSYKEGDRVSVKSGPWEDAIGTVTAVDEEEGKITLSVEMFMRNVSIDIPLGDVKAA